MIDRVKLETAVAHARGRDSEARNHADDAVRINFIELAYLVVAAEAHLATPLPGAMLPVQITEGIRKAINDGYMGWTANAEPGRGFAEGVYNSLLAHLTKPKTKMVETWHVEYCDVSGEPVEWHVDPRSTKEVAENVAAQLALDADENRKRYYACIRVTGPHQQEVPA